MQKILNELKKGIQEGNLDEVKSLVQQAIDKDLPPQDILENGLRPAMEEVGDKFEKLEIFLPEMMQSADAMAAAVEILQPHLNDGAGEEKKGRIVLGTVQGDVHKIGKDIVRIMLEGAGFEVIDLGYDVSDRVFLEEVRKQAPDILAMSSLMTTTMQNIPRVIKALETSGIRDSVKVIVGGAPVLPEWATEIGSDGYGANSAEAVRVVKELMK